MCAQSGAEPLCPSGAYKAEAGGWTDGNTVLHVDGSKVVCGTYSLYPQTESVAYAILAGTVPTDSVLSVDGRDVLCEGGVSLYANLQATPPH